jgi:transcriptional regulator with XRE-family HTH domain
MTRQRLNEVKEALRAKGWSYRTAAPELGVSFEHVSRVLNGQRVSKRLLDKIEALPVRPEAIA